MKPWAKIASHFRSFDVSCRVSWLCTHRQCVPISVDFCIVTFFTSFALRMTSVMSLHLCYVTFITCLHMFRAVYSHVRSHYSVRVHEMYIYLRSLFLLWSSCDFSVWMNYTCFLRKCWPTNCHRMSVSEWKIWSTNSLDRLIRSTLLNK